MQLTTYYITEDLPMLHRMQCIGALKIEHSLDIRSISEP